MSYDNIIPADIEVFPVCADIAIRAWQKGYSEYEEILGTNLFNKIFPGWEQAKADSMEPYFMGGPGKYAYIVLAEGEIAGFITCDMDKQKKIGTICNNAIDPDFQGRGLGSNMYDFILDVFRMEGMQAAAVATMDEDAYLPARKAYEKAGFKKKLRRLTYYMEL